MQLTAHDCQRLGGISIGGWVAFSLIAGAALGAAGVLLLQALRRRRDARYAREAPAAAAAAAHHQAAAPAACKRPRLGSPQAPPLLPTREPAVRGAKAQGAGSATVFSPLAASLHAPAGTKPPAGARGAPRRDTGGGGRGDQAPPPPGAPGSVASSDRHAEVLRAFATTQYVEEVGLGAAGLGARAFWGMQSTGALPHTASR